MSESQGVYDQLVNITNCGAATDSLECLRNVDYNTLMDAVNETPNTLSYTSLMGVWRPRVDGDVLPRNPACLVQSGKYAKVSGLSFL